MDRKQFMETHLKASRHIRNFIGNILWMYKKFIDVDIENMDKTAKRIHYWRPCLQNKNVEDFRNYHPICNDSWS